MPVTKIKSRWDSGNLIFHESTRLDDEVNVLTLDPDIVTIGDADNDVDFKIHMGTEGTGEAYALFNCGEKKVYFTGLSCELDGDLDVTVGDISLTDDQDIMFGDSDDVLMRFATTGDTSNPVFVLALDDTSQQMHITDKAAVNTNWGRTAGSDPEVAIHSDTTPISNYLAIGNHDGTTAHIDVVGGTTLSLDIAGTPEVVIATASTSPATSGSNALGTASLMWTDLFLADTAVINFNAGDVTITHGTDTLTLASTWTVDAVGRPWGVNLTLSVLGGNYVNAIKGYVDCTTNDGGTIGLLSAVNCEIAMPDVCRGAYYPLEIEWVGKTSTAFGDPGTGSQSGFMSINCSGFRNYINSAGVFFTLNGLTAGIGGMLGAGSSTLRIDINQGTPRYIPLSTAEGSYTTAYPIISSYSAGSAVAVTSTTPTTATNVVSSLANIGDTWASGEINAVYGKTTVTLAATGDTWNCAGGHFETQLIGDAGLAQGLVCALMAKLESNYESPNCVFIMESYPHDDADFTAIPFMAFADYSDEAKQHGILFEVGHQPMGATCSTGATGIFDNSTLRIKVNGTIYWLPLSTATNTFTTAYPISVGLTGTPITLGLPSYQFEVYTTVDTTAAGWYNAVVFDTQTTNGAAITGNAQVVGVQCYARLNAGSWTASGGLTGISSVLVGTGSSTTTNGILQAMTAVIQLNSGWGTGGTGAEVAGLVIQNQADSNASITSNHFHGIYIYCPNPSYLAFDNALTIQALSANGIYWEQTSTAYVFKWEERKAGIVGYGAGAPLNDISGTANQGFLKCLVEGQTRYIALYVEKT